MRMHLREVIIRDDRQITRQADRLIYVQAQEKGPWWGPVTVTIISQTLARPWESSGIRGSQKPRARNLRCWFPPKPVISPVPRLFKHHCACPFVVWIPWEARKERSTHPSVLAGLCGWQTKESFCQGHLGDWAWITISLTAAMLKSPTHPVNLLSPTYSSTQDHGSWGRERWPHFKGKVSWLSTPPQGVLASLSPPQTASIFVVLTLVFRRQCGQVVPPERLHFSRQTGKTVVRGKSLSGGAVLSTVSPAPGVQPADLFTLSCLQLALIYTCRPRETGEKTVRVCHQSCENCWKKIQRQARSWGGAERHCGVAWPCQALLTHPDPTGE